jgi:hypothetical protein
MLRSLAHAALGLGEAREAGQARHGVSQLPGPGPGLGVGVGGQAADRRAEGRNAGRAWNWMIGVLVSHHGERFAGLRADSRIGRSVFAPCQPVRLAGPPGRGRGQEGAGAAVSAIGMAGIAGGVEQAGADGRVPRPDRGAAVLGPGPGGDAWQLQPGGVTARYPGGKWRS